MGFTEVYDYTVGKLDWLAAGLPTEGSNPQHPRAGDVARTDAPTCASHERVGDVAARVRETGWNACVGVDDSGVVLGLLREKELAAETDRSIEEVMRPGPSTFRPYVGIAEMANFMTEHKLDASPITTSDGRLVGVLRRQDAVEATHAEHERHADA